MEGVRPLFSDATEKVGDLGGGEGVCEDNVLSPEGHCLPTMNSSVRRIEVCKGEDPSRSSWFWGYMQAVARSQK